MAPGPAVGFVHKLVSHGCVIGASTLCRYETGAEPVPASVVCAYELALGLPEGQLLGVCAGVDRMFGSGLASETSPEGMSRAMLVESLAGWEARVAGGSMRGADWVRMAEVLSQPSGLVLPPSVVRSWLGQLVAETLRSVNDAYTMRAHALGLLLGEPGISRIVLDIIEEAVAEPGAQSVTKVIALLGSSPDTAVLDWLIDRFERSTGEVQWGAAHGLLSQICRGTLPIERVPGISRGVLNAAAEGLDRGRPAFMVAQRLSADLTQQVVARLGCYPAPVVSGARVQSPAGLSAYRSAALHVSGLDDPMVDRLLREALSPDFVERRHHSSLLLAASPYRNALANAAVRMLASSAEPYVRESAAHLLTYVAGREQRHDLVGMLATVPQHRASLLVALTRCGGVPMTVDLVAMVGNPEQSRDVVYAAGMSDHPALRVFAVDAELAGSELQRTAQWWRRMGPAVTDFSQEVGADVLHTVAG
ncbi:hypothetical protein EFY87_13045 [Flexivirga caeni]|uniref:Uncharacterized protein n=2 Tax=Flexivirga caeni TaxID=2294115 RepID=A0A3M9M6J5_9MICO|nr:hypothetical protein EFY87_13045 [Flexivirga caeni]